jgi:hypothetical protein
VDSSSGKIEKNPGANERYRFAQGRQRPNTAVPY